MPANVSTDKAFSLIYFVIQGRGSVNKNDVKHSLDALYKNNLAKQRMRMDSMNKQYLGTILIKQETVNFLPCEKALPMVCSLL